MNRPSYKEWLLDEYKDRAEQLQWIRNAVNGEAKFCYSAFPYSEEEELARKIMQMHSRIAELEAENIRLGIEYQRMRLALGDIAINSKRALKESPTDQLTAHSDIERQDDKPPNDTQTETFVYGKEDSEVQE